MEFDQTLCTVHKNTDVHIEVGTVLAAVIQALL